MEKMVKFWLDSAKENFKIAQDMFKTGHYEYTAFLCQQSIEVLLKAIIVLKTKATPPHLHDLIILHSRTGLKVPAEIRDKLKEINPHYIEARYFQERFNSKVYNKANASFLLKSTQEVIEWFTQKVNLKFF